MLDKYSLRDKKGDLYVGIKAYMHISSYLRQCLSTYLHLQRVTLKSILIKKKKKKDEDVLNGLPCFTATFYNL